MKLTLSIAAWTAALAVSVSAQSVSVYFSTEGTETAAGGAGGTQLSPGNFAAVFRDEEIVMVVPGAGSRATSCAPRAVWSAHFGDDDADGLYTEAVVGRIDALHLAPGAANPPSLFDFYLSVTEDVIGPGGTTFGVQIRDGDVFRLRPGGVVVNLITEAQVASAMGTTADLNVDGFARHAATGDLYWSLSTTQFVNGTAVEDGGLVRLPATGYVAGADGTVVSVTPGAAQIVLSEAIVDVFFVLAGQGVVGDLKDFDFSPGGGSFLGLNGVQVPNLWLAGDTTVIGPAVVDTATGTFAAANGVALNGGPALGLSATDWQGLPNSSLTGLALGPVLGAARPRVLATSDVALVTPGTLKIDAGGFAAGSSFYLVLHTAVVAPAGLYSPRLPVAAGSVFDVAGGYPQLYVVDLNDPLVAVSFAFPPLVCNAQGYASLSFAVPLLPPGVGVLFQAVDASNLALTTPVVVVTQ
jgi:hypothetical protein